MIRYLFFSLSRPFCFTALLIFLFACGAQPTARSVASKNARVVEWKPGKIVEQKDAVLRFTFDRSMVSIEDVGPALANPPLRIEPETPLDVHWDDPKTLMVRPRTEWKEGERYQLHLLASGLGAVDEPKRFTFDVLPLLTRWSTLPETNAPRQPEFQATFSLPVEAVQAAKVCVLVGPKGERFELKLRPSKEGSSPKKAADNVPFVAAERLALDTRYRLDCEGLLPASGGAPWHKDPNDSGFTTHGLLRLNRAQPQPGSALPPEKARICLSFSTPIDKQELARHIRITPAPKGFADAWYEGNCDESWLDTDRANSVLLTPRTDFRLELDGELTDIFGQKLGKSHSISFRTADRVPGLWTATGVARVLEYGREGHSVGTLNLNRAKLTCAEVAPNQLAAGFERVNRWIYQIYDFDADGKSVPFPWPLPKITPRVRQLDSVSKPNTARNLDLNLGEMCGAERDAPGIYILEIEPIAPKLNTFGRQGDVPARLLANVTDLAVVAKRGAHNALVWVTRLSNGALVAGANVDLLNDNGTRIGGARTDARGMARFNWVPRNEEISDEDIWFVVRAGNDIAVIGSDWLWREGLHAWQLGVRQGEQDDGLRLFAHTDRGVYRPGERVLLHGLAREISDVAPCRVPAERAVILDLSDEGESIYHRELELSDFGSFSAEIDLPQGIKPGTHRLEITAAGKTDTHWVRVAEFRPVTFEIVGGPRSPEVLAPETVSVDLQMRYLFGAEVKRAAVRWTVERFAGEVRAPDFSSFSFYDNSPALPEEEPWPQPEQGVVTQRDENADSNGRARLSFETQAERGPMRYQISAEVTDSGNDRVSRSFSVLAHSADRYVGTRFRSWVFGDEPLQAEVVLVDREGKAVPGDARVELRHVSWNCGEPFQSCKARVRVLETQEVRIAASKPASVSFEQRASGTAFIRATVSDAQGRVARASDSAWVWTGYSSDIGPYSDRISAELSVDQRAYRVGQRARLALQTPLRPSHFLVTAERADVLDAKVVPYAAASPWIHLGPATAPNAFLTLTGTLGRSGPGEQGRPRLVAGAREVVVQGDSRALTAAITLARDTYEPHERVEGEVRVTHLGRPVMAEVALAAVNESVLQLTGFPTPDPTQVFHAPRGLSVVTLSNITQVIADPRLAAQVPEVTRIEEREEGTDGNTGRSELRDDYVAAAYWAPALHTDKRGRVEFAFDAPTDLSAYRLMAVVSTKDDRVGSTDTRVTVHKPLSVRPLTPRFASRGDSLDLGALIHDNTAISGAVNVSFDASGISLAKKQTQVDKSQTPEQIARTRGIVGDVSEAWFEAAVQKASYSDRVRHEFVVRRPLDTELRVLARKRAKQVRAKLEWPKGIDRRLSRVEITVDRAGLAPLAPALAHLVSYPYGCTEQTAAALSAISAVPELALAIEPEITTKDGLEAKIRDGFSRILQSRTDDGHYSAYPGMGGRAWLTAVVLEAALSARDAELHVSEGIVSSAISVLSDWLKRKRIPDLSRDDLSLAAYVAWLLSRASAPVAAAEDALFIRRNDLGIDDKAYLLRAWAGRNLYPKRRAELRASLKKLVWKVKQLRESELLLRSLERTRALVLQAFLAEKTESEEQIRLAHWLTDRAEDPQVYLSTRDIADVLNALSAWAREGRAGASRVDIGAGNKRLWSGTLSGAQVASIGQSAREINNANLWVEADGEVTVSIRRRDVSPTKPKPEFSRGLTIKRRYLDPETNKPVTRLSLGDVVQVELQLRTDRAYRMVVLSDPIPGGLEPLDPGLSTGRLAGCDHCDNRDAFDHVWRRDDRVDAFAERLSLGTHTLRYLLRANLAGTYSAPGAAAEAMYLPNIFARSAVSYLKVSNEQNARVEKPRP